MYNHNISADENNHFDKEAFSIKDVLRDSSESGSPRLQLKESCNPLSKYRNIDGSCNNEIRTEYGKSNTPLQRLLTPSYKNGS